MQKSIKVELDVAIDGINYLFNNHLKEYSISGIQISVEDFSRYERLTNRVNAVIFPYKKVIFINKEAFEYQKIYSDYLNRYVNGNPITHLILHEIHHYLIFSGQKECEAKGTIIEELACDFFAEKYNRLIGT